MASFADSVSEHDEQLVERDLMNVIEKIKKINDRNFRYHLLDLLAATAEQHLGDWYDDHMR